MLSLPRTCRCFALLLCVALTGCALDKYSFQTFGQSNRPAQTYADSPRSDELALIYADYVARLLEGRSSGARVTREVSDSSLAVGGAFLAATETLEISAETVAGMGVGMVIIRELQKIFNAGGRSEVFADAAHLIRQAQSEFRQFNPNPRSDFLTENGAILVTRVDAAVHAARKSLNGRMPNLLDLKQATQPMTEDGATRKGSGTPGTMYNAAGDKPGETGATAAELEGAVDRAVQEMKRIQPRQVKTQIVQPPTPTEAQATIDSLTAELSGTPNTNESRIKQLHLDIVGGAQGTDMDALKDAVNEQLRATRNQFGTTDASVIASAQAQLKEYLKAFKR
jgi:hypothetical protein